MNHHELEISNLSVNYLGHILHLLSGVEANILQHGTARLSCTDWRYIESIRKLIQKVHTKYKKALNQNQKLSYNIKIHKSDALTVTEAINSYANRKLNEDYSQLNTLIYNNINCELV